MWLLFFFLLILKRMSKIHKQILNTQKDIQYAVAPKFVKISTETDNLVDLAIDLWRMEQRTNKILPNLPKNEQESINKAIQKMKRFLDKNDIEIVDHTNQKFNEGQNLDILNMEIDPNIKESRIKETIEPTILFKGQVIRKGKIIVLAKSNNEIQGA
jgi:molecular chaperone GrpE (heat shock protein)